MSVLTIPAPVRTLFSYFPLHTYPPIPPPFRAESAHTLPTLWILPPPPSNGEGDLLSADVECLKWQAYLALRGLERVAVRTDVASDGALGGRLPCLHVPLDPALRDAGVKDGAGEGELLAPHMIPAWVDARVGELNELEGYRDEASKDESRAWVSLLEGNVHAALLLAQPTSLLDTLLGRSTPSHSLETVLSPPPPPLSGMSSLLPPYGLRVSPRAVNERYREAVAALSERLGTDKWFLGSENPTALDALAFAYLHRILHSSESVRLEVTRRVNLVAWERRVATVVRGPFIKRPS